MRKLVLLLQIIPVFALAQSNSEWGAFNQTLSAKNLAGKKFQLEGAVKVELIDPRGQAELWVRVDRPNKKLGFFYNMTDKPIRETEWKVYSITGTIDKDAEYISFGGLYGFKGIYHFDDFHLFVETTADKFEEIPIGNGSFEADTLQNWNHFINRDNVRMSATNQTAYKGNKSCRVDASELKKANVYGNNDSTGKFATANGIKIYYEEYGQGEPLLLLHGNSESINSFHLQIPEFSKSYHVIAVDTRGQGKSTEDGKLYTYDLFAEDMNALLEYLKLEKVNILGWSDGGNTGLIMAMKYPQRVKKLVTMGANVFIDNTVVDEWVFKELNKQKTELKSDTSTWAKNRIRLINLLLTEPKHTFAELKTISNPVLVVAGEKDVIKVGHTRKIAENIPKSKLIIARKETHEFPWENPKEFNKIVLDFLNRPNE